MSHYIFGEIKGTYNGQLFANRRELYDSGIHNQLQAGIQGKESEGCCSIVLSGGYEDDIDDLDEILYTGHGGRDEKTKKQIADQDLSTYNIALIKSYLENLPVRVTRGFQIEYGPSDGYRYDGIYYVTGYEYTKGSEGFMVYQFNLSALSTYNNIKKSIIDNVKPDLKFPDRKERRVSQLVRNPAIPRNIKKMYKNICQVCRQPLKGKRNGLICKGAHIEPVGQPHNGPDVESNMLCLCPNHHDMFDDYGFTINEDLTINIDDDLPMNESKILFVNESHNLDIKYINNHRDRAKNYDV